MLPFVQLGKRIDRRFNGGVAGFLGDQFNPFEVPDDPNGAAFTRPRPVRGRRRRAAAARPPLRACSASWSTTRSAAESAGRGQGARRVLREGARPHHVAPPPRRRSTSAAEPDKVRERYGRTPFGQSCLLARRLVEAGVQFVTVTDGGWDTHTEQLQEPQGPQPAAPRPRPTPPWSRTWPTAACWTTRWWCGSATSAARRRSTRRPGRDHWASAGVACMGGGGVKMGQVVGATNALGEFVIDTPVGAAGSGRDDLPRARRPAAHLVQDPGRPADRAGPGGQAGARTGGVSPVRRRMVGPPF